MKLKINGQHHELPSTVTVEALLAHLGLAGPVLVELNGLALFERDFPKTGLAEGDRVELVRIAAGG